MKLLVLFLFITGTFLTTNSQAESLKIGILVFDGVLTSDVTAPIEVFGAATKKALFANYEVLTISAGAKKRVKTEEGLHIFADMVIEENIKLDVLIVPSAYEMKPLLANEKLITFIKTQGDHVKWLASNCSGAFLLAEAGFLNGKKATTWFGGEKELASQYSEVNVQYDQNVVIDENIITSNGGVVSYQSALILLEQLTSAKFSREISDLIQLPRLLNSQGL